MSQRSSERTERLIGVEGYRRLRSACVVVFGLGGVGSFCVEALARSGVGRLVLVDHDVIADTNCNRQLHALQSTIGRRKVDVMAERVRDIDPEISVEPRYAFFAKDTASELLSEDVSFVVDAIDAMGPKIELLARCREQGLRVVSAMGAGARLDPTLVRVGPLAKTSGDPLAARVRKMLRRRGGLDGITAVYSVELPRKTSDDGDWQRMSNDLVRGRQRYIQPSMTMVPGTMGFAAAAEVVRGIASGVTASARPNRDVVRR